MIPKKAARLGLKNLEVYCFALSIAGIKPAEPPPSGPETVNSDSTRYVMVLVGVQSCSGTRTVPRNLLGE